MDKYRVQIDWLNKLYDDIYFSELEDNEHAMDIISTLIADKEVKPITTEEKNLTSIIIEVSEELAELFDSEGLTECYNFIVDKIEKVQDGELDEALREEYFPDLFDLEKDTEISDDDFDEIDDMYVEEESIDQDDDTYIEEYPEEDDDEENDEY
ncbi:hypothetical protein GOQ27_01485 [Clostridium sp. D2Q-11]|uniref:Uncharacterized protein n=1 Tax=Anaeromonas frigoriresistens TaxID=2683708 RepID=A0A942Z7C5_9FIRM|nr:hypothetical protein [Anaeromonas frigoriresistens]MBS4537113.1 hypothetical protein [Anaeromonas frigoriresistens]